MSEINDVLFDLGPRELTECLSDRFIVPPFSVLDAKQGYWQDRKREWMACGIKGELGRGENSGPGGSPRDAANQPKDGLTVRGDGRGKGLARCFGQDLMRGEHVVGYEANKVNANLDPKTQRALGCYMAAGGAVDRQGGQTGTSIFDPVLCELAYSWFCPKQGHILDPFAGGSVRGIVAHILDRRYTGIDLSTRQIEANETQAAEILATPRIVKISAASARQEFAGCSPDYIRDVCHATCCESSTARNGTLIAIHPSEQGAIESIGGVVEDGFLLPRPGEGKCPFKGSTDLCKLHATKDKPFGCIASPFTLNTNGTMIIRNRYRLLKCYKDGAKIPAYIAFRASLDLILGADEAARICRHLDDGGGDIEAEISEANWRMLVDNDAIKHGTQRPAIAPRGFGPTWLNADSMDVATVAPDQYDFIFTCPPYGNLERYSDDPRDISTLTYPEFKERYAKIILACAGMLRENRFACVVVGDFRDKKGFYCNFVSDTIAAFAAAGMGLYNEAILLTSVGSLPIRVGKQFTAGRKLGKTHQNVLVFCKGDPKKATVEIGPVDNEDLMNLMTTSDVAR